MEFTVKENGKFLRALYQFYREEAEIEFFGVKIKSGPNPYTSSGPYHYSLWDNIFHVSPNVNQISEIDGKDSTITVYVDNPIPPVLSKAVNLSADDTLIVPVGAKETYAKDPKWGKFKNIREDASLCGGKTEQKPPKETNKIEELEKRVAELEKIVAQLQKKIK